MTKPEWVTIALGSLEFFVANPEYGNEFGHKYFMDRCNVSRQTLYRNDLYMTRYREVSELLKQHKVKSTGAPSRALSGDKEEIQELQATVALQKTTIAQLQLRLNECYQMLEDHGIDPEFIYPRRLKKHREA